MFREKGMRRPVRRGIIIVVVLIIAAGVLVWKVSAGIKQSADQFKSMENIRLAKDGFITKLTITPVVEFLSGRDDLGTEAGVSYLIQADDTCILMDLGLNKKGKHPSILVNNMSRLGMSPESVDMIFLSHIHPDHIGGMKELFKKKFSLSHGSVSIGPVPVYATGKIAPSEWNPGPVVQQISGPFNIKPGIATTGPVLRYTIIGGMIREQSLLIRLKGKGTVVIIGCGHGGLDRILARARSLFGEPVYAVIGGIHLPVGSSRVGPSFINIQNFGATDRLPVGSATIEDVDKAVSGLKSYNPSIAALSAHDSSDQALDRIKNAFGNRFRILRAGEPLEF